MRPLAAEIWTGSLAACLGVLLALTISACQGRSVEPTPRARHANGCIDGFHVHAPGRFAHAAGDIGAFTHYTTERGACQLSHACGHGDAKPDLSSGDADAHRCPWRSTFCVSGRGAARGKAGGDVELGGGEVRRACGSSAGGMRDGGAPESGSVL